MPTYQETIQQALELKVQIEDLRSSTYTVVRYDDPRGSVYMFIASFEIDTLSYGFAITDPNWVEIKAMSTLHPETMAAYGKFIDAMLAYTKGEPHPYPADVARENPPHIMTPHEVASAGINTDDRHVDDSEAELK